MNPWKTIPVEDYDGHMNHPSVDQQTFLADFFEEAVDMVNPSSLLLAGCATGNGLVRLRKKNVSRAVALDINERFLAAAKEKFGTIPNLEFRHCSVLEYEEYRFDLIFAGLLLEYIDPTEALNHFHTLLNPGGTVAVLIQLESEQLRSITPTEFTRSLDSLSSILNHVDPAELKRDAVDAGFSLQREDGVILDSGKEFARFLFRKES